MKENILNKLKESYKLTFGGTMDDRLYRKRCYLAIRAFCLDCNLISFEEIELMEFETRENF